MPKIAHIANLWSLVHHPSKKHEWSLEKKIKAVADAGFDGFTTGLTPEHKRLAKKYGLKHVLGFVSSSDPKNFAALSADELAKKIEATKLYQQLARRSLVSLRPAEPLVHFDANRPRVDADIAFTTRRAPNAVKRCG